MNKIKLLAFDLDGTATPMMGTGVSPGFRAALDEAAALGVVCAVFSGRALSTIPRELCGMDSVRFLSYANGAGIVERSTGHRIYSSPMPQQLCLDALAILAPYDLAVQVFSDGQMVYPRRILDDTKKYGVSLHHLEAIRSGEVLVVDDLADYVRRQNPIVDKLNISRAEGGLRARLAEELKALPQLEPCSSGGSNLEINCRSTSKGAALRFLADYLGLPLSQVMAVGDNLNDNSMILAAGLGVAMGDGAPETLALADYVTASQAEDGAAMAIRKFVLPSLQEISKNSCISKSIVV